MKRLLLTLAIAVVVGGVTYLGTTYAAQTEGKKSTECCCCKQEAKTEMTCCMQHKK